MKNGIDFEDVSAEDFNEILTEEARKSGMIDEAEDGRFEFEIYPDYRDEISEDRVREICESEDPEETFREWVQDAYENAMDYYRNEIEEELMDKIIAEYGVDLSEEQEQAVSDFASENVCFKLPYDNFLDQKIRVDIYVDTGDANYDFVLNHRYPAWGGEIEDEIDPKASIRWLAGTQGYTEPQLRAALAEGDLPNPNDFLESLRVELANTPSNITALVILAEMSVRDVIELNRKTKQQEVNGIRAYDADSRPDCGSIHISKKAEVGLYNSWDGGGGPFEIMLEKDFDLPLKYIHSALPDGSVGRWSIEETYGMCRSAWRDVVTEVSGKEVA